MKSNILEAEQSFSIFDLADPILRGIAGAGFENPRPIQHETIPAVQEGRDVLGLAQTGTGKTAAFAIPILQKLLSERKPGPRILVIAPTRELAGQIAAEFRLLATHTKLRVMTIFGGVSDRPQIATLRSRPEVIVACPGRLLDLCRQGAVSFERVETLVLDEADHMFDMGFLPDIRRIIGLLPEARQNLLFSATMPPEIRRLANLVLRDPHVVDVTKGAPPLTIEHAIYPVDDTKKRDALNHLLSEPGFVSAIVFTRTKHRAKRLALQLAKAGRRAVALQGNMSQNARDHAMKRFRDQHYEILVATDIAARGIDVAQVSHVINFDMPDTPNAYTHRIGRTGRAERSGKAYTFVTREDVSMVREVERLLGAAIPRREINGVSGHSNRPSQPDADKGRNMRRASRPYRGGARAARSSSR